MDEETIGSFLGRLAARTPAPGGGATAALHAAQAAALLAMVARFSDGPQYARHAETIEWVLAEASRLREECVQLIAADADAFSSVAAAYKLPRETGEQAAARSGRHRCRPDPRGRAARRSDWPGTQLLNLAQVLQPVGNRNVITDVAAAAEALRAAIATARINVEVNLTGITDADAKAPD